MVNPAEGEQLKGRVLQELQQNGDLADKLANGETNKERIERSEWMIILFQQIHAKQSEANSHNFNVASFNSLLSYARRIKEISEVRPIYYINQKTGDFIVEVENKMYGLIPDLVDEDDSDDVFAGMGEFDLGSEKSMEELGYTQIDEADWFLISVQNVNTISQISAHLSLDLAEMEGMYEQVLEFEEQEGLTIEFYVEGETNILSYAVKKKKGMGFSLPVHKEKPTIVEE